MEEVTYAFIMVVIAFVEKRSQRTLEGRKENQITDFRTGNR